MMHYCNEHSDHSILQELLCHLPYSMLAVTVSLVIISFMYCFSMLTADKKVAHDSFNLLFHNFHYLHLAFATSGSIAMFFRYSKNIALGIIVAVFGSGLLCVLSDVFFPYISGVMLGFPMKLHVCLYKDSLNAIVFLGLGVISGIAHLYHKKRSCKNENVIFIHSMHVFVSALASCFYLVGHGFEVSKDSFGFIYIMMVLAVVVPCTLSDVFLPMLVARLSGKK